MKNIYKENQLWCLDSFENIGLVGIQVFYRFIYTKDNHTNVFIEECLMLSILMCLIFGQ